MHNKENARPQIVALNAAICLRTNPPSLKDLHPNESLLDKLSASGQGDLTYEVKGQRYDEEGYANPWRSKR